MKYPIADLASLNQYITSFTEFLTSSGLGALPLIPPARQENHGLESIEGIDMVPQPTDEAALLKHAEQLVTTLYARQKQLQENNGVVAGLLSAEGSIARKEK